jgi:hypothetical protein
MKKSILTLALLCATITTSVAQDITPSKNNFGVTLSTNIFGLNDELNHVAVGGGFYFSRKITNKLSIYSEIDGSSRNYGDLSIMPSLSGEFTTGNLAIYLGPMFDIGHHFGNKFSIGTRYEWGLNSIFKNVDRKVSTISFNMFLPLGGKRSQNKGN